jgi:hypothetical protein
VIARTDSVLCLRILQLIFNDLPQTSFRELFEKVSASDSVMNKNPDVFVLASGVSFYQQIAPCNSILLGYSATSFHWLSKIPCPVPDAISYSCAGDFERACFKQQAAKDWDQLLSVRAKELLPGGCLLIVSICTDENRRTGQEAQLNHMWQTASVDMAHAPDPHLRMQSAELSAFTLQTYYRSVEEHVDEATLGRSNLEVLKCNTQQPLHPLWERYQTTKNVNKFAEETANYIRGYTESLLRAAILGHTSAEQHQAPGDLLQRKVDAYYRYLQERVKAHPQDFASNPRRIYLLLRKKRAL